MAKKTDSIEKEFLRLIHEHQKIIYKVCKVYRDDNEDQKDLFQEIVYQLWKSYPGFRQESKFSSWMYRIALNTAIAVYRKPAVSINYRKELPDQNYSQNENDIRGKDERLFWALRQLSNLEKAIVSLYLEDFNYKEISAITGLTESNIGVRLNRIKIKLKKLLK